MSIYSSKFCTIDFDAAKKQIIQVWKEETGNMSSMDFQAEQSELAKILNANKPLTFFTDALTFNYVIPPDIQEWNAERVLATFAKNGGKKIGILIPPDIFAQVSIQQALDEVTDSFQTRYFENKAEMVKWLNE